MFLVLWSGLRMTGIFGTAGEVRPHVQAGNDVGDVSADDGVGQIEICNRKVCVFFHICSIRCIFARLYITQITISLTI